MTYGAILAHALVRSMRIMAALANQVPIEQLRPIACLRMVQACARELIDALSGPSAPAWERVTTAVGWLITEFARERRPSCSRPRIALNLGAIGA